MIEDLAPFMMGSLLFMIPIVAILAKHQQKMAEITRRNVGGGDELQRLEHEVRQLRESLAHQAFAIDQLASTQRELVKSLGEGKSLEQRLHPS
ncbi:MAG: hypothetical protein M9921_01135 [Fimbriimonadaceae bacterium]|nr:hypothetical protein [Fimbriimonadaceae bacterium]